MPYCPTLALNRMGFPEGFSCRHSNPIRYIVGEASHPVNSATVARSPRESVEIHRVYSVSYIYLLYIQSCNIVSHANVKLTSLSECSGLLTGKRKVGGWASSTYRCNFCCALSVSTYVERPRCKNYSGNILSGDCPPPLSPSLLTLSSVAKYLARYFGFQNA